MRRCTHRRKLAFALSAPFLMAQALVGWTAPCSAEPVAGLDAHSEAADHRAHGTRHHDDGEQGHLTRSHDQVPSQPCHPIAAETGGHSAGCHASCCASNGTVPLSVAAPSASMKGGGVNTADPASSKTLDLALPGHDRQFHRLHSSALAPPATKHKPFGSLLI